MRISLLVLLVILLPVSAEDWPGWRGPRGDGTSLETHLPLRWSATENVRWKVSVPGTGHSSPIVVGDRVFVTSCREATKERLLLCFDRRDGKLLWERVVVTAPLEKKHKLNSFASATPASDGERVYVSFFAPPRVAVACYSVAGEKLWQKSPGEFHSVHGFCSPPIIVHDLVVVNGDQDHADAFLVALDKTTGEQRWRVARPGVRSYCPPTVFDVGGKRQMVMSGSNHVHSYDPETGQELWKLDGPTEQFVASFVYHDGLFFMTSGFPEFHMLAIRPDGSVAWRHTKGAGYVPAPVAWDHHFYLVKDDGLASCLVAATGERPWTERLGKHHTASPVAADGHVYFTEDDGTTHVLKAGPKFDVIARNKFGEECYASPAVAQGNLFYRTKTALWCIGQ